MKKLGVIGVGNMGEAIIRGLLEKKVFRPADLIASHPRASRRRTLARTLRIKVVSDNREVVAEAPVILVAVKPQTLDSVLEEIALAFSTNNAGLEGSATAKRRAEGLLRQGSIKSRLFISVVAGVRLAHFEQRLGAGARVVRVMPNAPALVGGGMAAVVRGSRATKADESLALRLFGAVGQTVAIQNESLLDAVTALSGSGPAYVALFLRALADAAVKHGIPPQLAYTMALQTASGTVKMLEELRLTPEKLIRMVASPGGTTEAALSKFSEANFTTIVAQAFEAAAQRSRELGATR